jgi:hypothetical protein
MVAVRTVGAKRGAVVIALEDRRRDTSRTPNEHDWAPCHGLPLVPVGGLIGRRHCPVCGRSEREAGAR